MTKLMDLVRWDAEAPSEVVAPLLHDPGLTALVVNTVREGQWRWSRDQWPDLEPFDAVVTRWFAADAEPRPLTDLQGTTVLWSFGVEEHIGIDRRRDWEVGVPTPGLKHLSLLVGAVEQDEFRRDYRHHVELVKTHLPLMWRYVQNDVVHSEGDLADAFAAISELSYLSESDYERRWRDGDASEREFRSHEGFLDLSRTVTVMCTEHVLFVSGDDDPT